MLIEDSLIMKYKNKSDDKIFEIVKNNLIEKFENYELEKNIKIYNDYKECKNLADRKNEKKNEFIIVDESFLNIMKMNNYENNSVLIKWNSNEHRHIIYFPHDKNYLWFENEIKREEIFKFKIVESVNQKINENNLIIKKELNFSIKIEKEKIINYN